MTPKEYSFTDGSAALLARLFFSAVKSLLVVFIFAGAVLVVSQSAIAPVSLQLLSSRCMEYAVATFKPYRHYFPEPFLIELETK